MQDPGQFNIKNIKLIVGLGNVGKEYEKTRHNIGFLFLDALNKYVSDTNSDMTASTFSENKKLKSLLAQKILYENKVILAKPVTLMNKSGQAVRLLQNYFNIVSSEILVVHDDLDLDVGKYKIQFKKGPKVHNGVNSIENTLKTSKFWRLRIGVEGRKPRERKYFPGIDYVLSRLSNEEKNLLHKTFLGICEKIFVGLEND